MVVIVIMMIVIMMIAMRLSPLPVLLLLIVMELFVRTIVNVDLHRPLTVIALLFRTPLMVLVIVRIVRPIRMRFAASGCENRCGNRGGKH